METYCRKSGDLVANFLKKYGEFVKGETIICV